MRGLSCDDMVQKRGILKGDINVISNKINLMKAESD